MRAIQPCGAYLSLRDQLGALAARQKEGGWVTLVVLHGTPEWAARPAGGCERDETQPRSRPARDMADYGRFVGAVLAEARSVGAELRYWSPWNEPNHPYFISPQRQECDRSARSAAVEPYVGMARALAGGAGRGAGRAAARAGRAGGARRAAADDDLGLGVRRADPEGRSPAPRRSGPSTGTSAAATSPTTSSARWSARAARGPSRSGSPRPASARPAAARSAGRRPAAQRRACARLHRRLARWYRDPRVTAAFQYTFREDDLFPTGLVSTDLTAAYSAARRVEGLGHERPPGADRPAAAGLLLLAHSSPRSIARVAPRTCASTTTPPPATASRSACCSRCSGATTSGCRSTSSPATR